MSKCCLYCNCDACRAGRLEMRELHLLDELGVAERALEIVCKQRDEARDAAIEILALLQSSAADHDHDEELFARWEWLKEQPTVDE